jgi:AcrR family transcriptional regulator
MPKSPLIWIRTAQQSRSQKTLERLLDATERLLEDRPFNAISVQHIVKTAKSSVGSFYARFNDKNALLQTLHQRFCSDVIETSKQFTVDTLDFTDLNSLLQIFTELMLSDLRDRPGLRRAFLVARPNDPHFQDRTHAVDAHLISVLERLLTGVQDEIRHPNLHQATCFAFEMANALAEYRLLYGVKQEFGPEFSGEMVRAIHGYLTQEP